MNSEEDIKAEIVGTSATSPENKPETDEKQEEPETGTETPPKVLDDEASDIAPTDSETLMELAAGAFFRLHPLDDDQCSICGERLFNASDKYYQPTMTGNHGRRRRATSRRGKRSRTRSRSTAGRRRRSRR